jgi:ribonuclease HI
VQQFQKVSNDISAQNTVGLHWVVGHAGVWGNKISDKLTRDGSVQKFVGPEPEIKHWMDNQHQAR